MAFSATRAAYVTRATADLWPPTAAEVCTEDSAEARQWAVAADSQVKGTTNYPDPLPLVGDTKVTAKYFEFTRQDGVLFRVHRCTYIDRSAYEGGVSSYDRALGTLAVRPVSTEAAQDAARYVYSLDPGLGTDTSLVLSTAFSDENGTTVLRLEAARLVEGDVPAEVSMRNLQITVDRATGEIRGQVGPVAATENEQCD